MKENAPPFRCKARYVYRARNVSISLARSLASRNNLLFGVCLHDACMHAAATIELLSEPIVKAKE